MEPVYFTTKVATGTAFCNRETERQVLARCIAKNQHTVITAPRRYGKTSLVIRTLAEGKQPYACIDLFCVVYEEDVCRKVARAVSNLIRKIATFSEKTIQLLEASFKTLSVGIKAGALEIKTELARTNGNAITQLEDLLQGLETFAAKHKTPVTLYFDEFQDVLKLAASNNIQATLRAIAQHSKYVTYIFSGSSRKMLADIFDDKNQPLYMLCKKIELGRIASEAFCVHIQKAARQQWKKPLGEATIAPILSLTECHPYYVNVLCDKLLEIHKLPNASDVESTWQAVLIEHRDKIIADLQLLNTNRLKVLSTIAWLNSINEPNSRQFLERVRLPLSTTQNAIKYLLDYDYLYEHDGELRLVDPLMKLFLRQQQE